MYSHFKKFTWKRESSASNSILMKISQTVIVFMYLTKILTENYEPWFRHRSFGQRIQNVPVHFGFIFAKPISWIFYIFHVSRHFRAISKSFLLSYSYLSEFVIVRIGICLPKNTQLIARIRIRSWFLYSFKYFDVCFRFLKVY